MKLAIKFGVLLPLWSALCLALAAQSPASSAPANTSALEPVLRQMDQASAIFKSAEAEFVWDVYQKVVDETDTQKGKIYFRRNDKETEMMADVSVPEQKYVLFSGGKVRLYQPKIEQETDYNVAKNRAEFETFLVLGFGGGGHDLLRSFDVHYQGAEKIDGTSTSILELIPKSQRVKSNVNRILLWVDAARGVSLKQQLFEPSGDYRLAFYSNIKINGKLPDDSFKLKTSARTRVVTPQ